MSKRYNHRGGRRQIVSERRDVVREQQLLAAPAQDVFSHHPVIKSLLDRLPNATPTEAANIGIVLQGLLRGDASMLANLNDPAISEELNKIHEKAEQEERVNEAFEKDREGFANEVFDTANKLILTEEQKERLIAEGMARYKKARQDAVAGASVRRLRLEARIAREPQVLIKVEGEPETIRVGGVQQTHIRPVVIKILHKTWVLTPGDQMVPQVVAEQYHRIELAREERRRRKATLDANRTGGWGMGDVEIANQKIDRELGVKRDHVMIRNEV